MKRLEDELDQPQRRVEAQLTTMASSSLSSCTRPSPCRPPHPLVLYSSRRPINHNWLHCSPVLMHITIRHYPSSAAKMKYNHSTSLHPHAVHTINDPSFDCVHRACLPPLVTLHILTHINHLTWHGSDMTTRHQSNLRYQWSTRPHTLRTSLWWQQLSNNVATAC